MMNNFLPESQRLFEFTRSIRRDLHQHPELAYQEVRTAGMVTRELNAAGMEVTTGIGKTGVIGLLEGEKPGPVVMLRFDMDALPILEETGAEYASQTPGVMHACGHDGHVAIGLTVARLLSQHRNELSGSVKFIFQPAEEGAQGALAVIQDGALETPRPTCALGLHVWNEKPVGWLGIAPGPMMASMDTLDVLITGKGGHGAAPHLSIDPILAAAQIITAVQSIVSRNIPPLQSAVVSITQIKSGETFNVIPSYARLQGTIRTFEPQVHQIVLERFHQIASGISAAMGCQAEIHLEPKSPSVINDAGVTQRVQQVAQQLFPHSEVDSTYRTMISEDMAEYLTRLPGCFILMGSANPEKGLDAGHHHPRFDFDEIVLPQAAALISAATLDLLHS